MSLSKTYQNLLKNHFMLVQAVQTGILMGAGDITAQLAIEKKTLKNYEPVRTAKFAFLGVCFVGPVLTTWYGILAKQFGTQKSPAVAAKKVLTDQLLFAPCFLVAFVANVHLLAGKNIEQIKKDLSNTYTDILLANWKIWPAAQIGPVLTTWYGILAKQFGTHKSPAVAAKKVLTDQLFFAPIYLVAFVANVHLLAGKNINQIKKDLSDTYTDILLANWKIWPAAQIVNFYIMPLKYQVLFAQVVAFFWNTYLSWKTQKAPN